MSASVSFWSTFHLISLLALAGVVSSQVVVSPIEPPSPQPLPHADESVFNSDGLSASPLPTVVPYDGVEFKWRNFLFRPGVFKQEGLAILTLVTYIFITKYGGSVNHKRAQSWIEENSKYLRTQFLALGVGTFEAGTWRGGNNAIMQDSGNKFVSWGTGRRGADGVLIEVQLKPRDDLLVLIYETIRGLLDMSYEGTVETATLTFKLNPTSLDHGFVWGIVNKNNLTQTRGERYDLRAFATKETEATFNSGLVIFSEHGDIVNALVQPTKAVHVGIYQVFSKIPIDYFESLIISDVGPLEPKGEVLSKTLRTLTLTLRIPPADKTNVTLPFIQLACNLIDVIDRMRLSPESIKKLKESRAEVEAHLQAESKKYAKDEAEEKKKAERKKAEEERYAAMTPAQQKKYDEKKKAKDIKKAQTRISKRK